MGATGGSAYYIAIEMLKQLYPQIQIVKHNMNAEFFLTLSIKKSLQLIFNCRIFIAAGILFNLNTI